MTQTDFQIRLAKQSDKIKWDEYIVSLTDASPYHLFAWKNAIEKSYGHKAYYLLAEEKQQVVGVLPLIHLKLPYLINELTALPFCDVGSILSDTEHISDLLLSEALLMRKKLKNPIIKLRGTTSISTKYSETFYPEETNKVRMFLDLPESSEILMQSFKSKLRSQIRKAEKNGLTFYWEEEDQVDVYYSVFSKNMHDLGSPVHSKQWFHSIMENYGNNAKMGIVAYESQVVGCCIILTVGNKVSIPWASTLRKFNKLAPNMLLYWNVLKYSADSGFKTFDFGRSSEGEGTFKFKKQWGAKATPLDWYSTVKPQSSSDNHAKHTSSSRDMVTGVWKNVPLPLANYLGPRIRKFISL